MESESEGGQKFLPPNPLPFCPPERLDFRIKNSDFRQKMFEHQSKNTAKIENRNRKPKWGRHEVLNVNADSVLRKHFWGRKPAKGLPAFGGAGGDQGRAGI